MKRNNAGIFFALLQCYCFFPFSGRFALALVHQAWLPLQLLLPVTTMTEMTTAAGAAADTTASATTIAGNSVQVICKNNKFQPDSLTVKAGTTVTWVNQDGYAPHCNKRNISRCAFRII